MKIQSCHCQFVLVQIQKVTHMTQWKLEMSFSFFTSTCYAPYFLSEMFLKLMSKKCYANNKNYLEKNKIL